MAPDVVSQPVDEDGLESGGTRSFVDRPELDFRFGSGAISVGASVAGRSGASTVATADGGSGVRHCGQNSPASCGTMTAAHVGQEMMLGTAQGLYDPDHATPGLLARHSAKAANARPRARHGAHGPRGDREAISPVRWSRPATPGQGYNVESEASVTVSGHRADGHRCRRDGRSGCGSPPGGTSSCERSRKSSPPG